jgi:hypothetical protein
VVALSGAVDPVAPAGYVYDKTQNEMHRLASTTKGYQGTSDQVVTKHSARNDVYHVHPFSINRENPVQTSDGQCSIFCFAKNGQVDLVHYCMGDGGCAVWNRVATSIHHTCVAEADGA